MTGQHRRFEVALLGVLYTFLPLCGHHKPSCGRNSFIPRVIIRELRVSHSDREIRKVQKRI